MDYEKNAFKKAKKFKYKYNSCLGKWYSWDSPVGLGLFLVSLTIGFSLCVGSIGYFISRFFH